MDRSSRQESVLLLEQRRFSAVKAELVRLNLPSSIGIESLDAIEKLLAERKVAIEALSVSEERLQRTTKENSALQQEVHSASLLFAQDSHDVAYRIGSSSSKGRGSIGTGIELIAS
jgi:uncharacterized protein YigA (DUF484 family)